MARTMLLLRIDISFYPTHTHALPTKQQHKENYITTSSSSFCQHGSKVGIGWIISSIFNIHPAGICYVLVGFPALLPIPNSLLIQDLNRLKKSIKKGEWKRNTSRCWQESSSTRLGHFYNAGHVLVRLQHAEDLQVATSLRRLPIGLKSLLSDQK